MAWTNPITFTSSVLTAAQLNTHLRDNLLETAPAKATAANRIFVSTGANSIAQREIVEDFLSNSETTTSTTFTDLPNVGPQVTVTTGTKALVFTTSQCSNSGTGSSVASFGVTGATTDVATDTRAVIQDGVAGGSTRATTVTLMTLTAGSNVFTLKYRVSSGTGTFQRRRLQIIAL